MKNCILLSFTEFHQAQHFYFFYCKLREFYTFTKYNKCEHNHVVSCLKQESTLFEGWMRGGAGRVDGAILDGALYLGAGAGQWLTGAGLERG